MRNVEWISQYSERHDEEAERCVVHPEPGEVSKADPQFQKDADINELARRFGLTDAPIPLVAVPEGAVVDTAMFPDLREALDQVRAGQDAFMSLPAHVRARFHNDIVAFHDFMRDERNRDEAVRLGIIAEVPKPDAVVPPKSE